MSIEVEDEMTRVAGVPRAKMTGRAPSLSTLLRDARLMLLALWLGAAVFFGAVVAPNAFNVLRARNVPYANEAAGSIASRTVAVVNISGFLIALLLLASAFLFRKARKVGAFIAETVALALMVVATGVGQWVIAARMLALRAAMGRPIDDVAIDNPLRASFDSLHGYSVKALGLAMIAAVAALLLIARRGQRSEAGD
ncbi:MAG: DUF4149 domain-containing protein [Acidobacteria bacterium]|nr:DUF4149 domain-containing protein [Acidobacteriota bacterium]